MGKDHPFASAKGTVIENLESIRLNLIRSIEGGMIDSDDSNYNEILGLLDEAHLSKNWDELMEVTAKAKTLENDLSNWFARHGKSNLSFNWPKHPLKL